MTKKHNADTQVARTNSSREQAALTRQNGSGNPQLSAVQPQRNSSMSQTPRDLIALQRSIGNRAVTNMLQPVRQRSAILPSQMPQYTPQGRTRNALKPSQLPDANNVGVAELSLNVDVETLDRTDTSFKGLVLDRYLNGGDSGVGHTWISLRYKNPTAMPQYTNLETEKDQPDTTKKSPPDALKKESLDSLQQGGEASFGFYPKGDNFWMTMALVIPSIAGEVVEPDHQHSPKVQIHYQLFQDDVNKLIGYVNSSRNRKYNLQSYNCTHFAMEAVAAAGHTPPAAKGLGGLYTMPNAVYKTMLEAAQRGHKQSTFTYGPDLKESAYKAIITENVQTTLASGAILQPNDLSMLEYQIKYIHTLDKEDLSDPSQQQPQSSKPKLYQKLALPTGLAKLLGQQFSELKNDDAVVSKELTNLVALLEQIDSAVYKQAGFLSDQDVYNAARKIWVFNNPSHKTKPESRQALIDRISSSPLEMPAKAQVRTRLLEAWNVLAAPTV